MAANDRFLQQSDCDPEDPEEHFAWGLTQMPLGMNAQTMPPNTARVMSAHLYELGFRHHPELQKKKLQMPHRGQQHWLNAMARWVPIDEHEPDPVMLPDVTEMTVHEQELMIQELKNIGRIQDPDPDLGPLATATTLEEILRGSDEHTGWSLEDDA